MNQNDEQRLKMVQGENQQQRPPGQKCPRCDSLNTKFCYYNNYSLSQPRYFCKTCERYWTQGGTLRNVRAGGKGHKVRHSKLSSSSYSASSSSSSSSSGDLNSRSQPPHDLQGTVRSIIVSNTKTPTLGAKALGNLDSPAVVAPNLMGSYDPATGGSFTSLAAFHYLNNQSFTHQPPNNPVNLWLNLGGSPNMGFLHGFNPVTSDAPLQHRQIQQQRQFHHVGSGDAMSGVYDPFYESEENLAHLCRPASSLHQQQINWHQVYMSNSTSNPAVHDATLWNASTSNTAANSISSNIIVNANASSSSLNPDQWDDLSAGYAPPP